MDGQLSFATLDYAGKKKRTKRDVFSRDGLGGAVVSAGSSDRAALSEGGSVARRSVPRRRRACFGR